MTKLMELRDKAVKFWGTYEQYLMPVVRFVVALVIFFTINKYLGFMGKISNAPVAVVLSLACSILPWNAMMLLAMLVICANMYALSMEAAITCLILFAIIVFAYFRFTPKDAGVAMLTPISFTLHMPYVMPLAAGLLRSIYSSIAIAAGTIAYYFLDGVRLNASEYVTVSGAETTGASSKLSVSVGQILDNKEMYLVLGILIVTTVIVNVIRRMRIDYSWTIAIIVGFLFEFVGIFIGLIVIGETEKILQVVIGGLVSLFIAFVIQFVCRNLDYARTERLQFEDDEYFYYVKAVPKKMVEAKDKSVKTFGNTATVTTEDSRRAIAEELDIDESLLK